MQKFVVVLQKSPFEESHTNEFLQLSESLKRETSLKIICSIFRFYVN